MNRTARRKRGEKRIQPPPRRCVNKSSRTVVPQNNAFINSPNRKVNYMHSKCSFPNRSKLRDLFSRVQSPLCTRDGIYNNILYRPGNDKQRIVTARYKSNNIHWYHGYL